MYQYIKNIQKEIIDEIIEKDGKFWKISKETQDKK